MLARTAASCGTGVRPDDDNRWRGVECGIGEGGRVEYAHTAAAWTLFNRHYCYGRFLISTVN